MAIPNFTKKEERAEKRPAKMAKKIPIKSAFILDGLDRRKIPVKIKKVIKINLIDKYSPIKTPSTIAKYILVADKGAVKLTPIR